MTGSKQRTGGWAALAAAAVLMGCSTTIEETGRTLEIDMRPPAESRDTRRDVAVPELDQRQQDQQFLSRIESMTAQIEGYRTQLATASAEREEAVSSARSARENESRIAREFEKLQLLLDDAQARERELQDQLLRARLEVVRLKKEAQLRKIKDLTDSAKN